MISRTSNDPAGQPSGERCVKHRGPQTDAVAARAANPAGPGRGFTLIEMLVVLMIISIVLALGAGVATSIISSTDKKDTIVRMHIVWEAISIYFEKTGDLPANVAVLSNVEECRKVLRRLPTASMSGANIKDCYDQILVYKPTGGKGGGAQLYSKGPDGRDGHAIFNRDNIYINEQE